MTLPDRLLILEWPNGHLSVEESPGEGRVTYVRADAFILTPKLPTSEADEAIVDALAQASRPKATKKTKKTKLQSKAAFAELATAIDAGGPLPSVLASAEAYEPEKKK